MQGRLCHCAGGGTWSGVDYFYIRKLIKNMSLTTLARLLFRCVAPHSIAPPFKSARSVRRYTSPRHIFPLRFNLCRGRDLNPHATRGARDFKSLVSTDSTTPA